MQLKHYTHARTNILNKLSIPDITDPFTIRIHWFQSLSYGDKSPVISREMHLHTFFEAHFIIDGQMDYASGNGTEYLLEKGKGILFTPCTEHIVESYSNNLFKFSLAFAVDETSDFYKNLTQKEIYTFDISAEILTCIDTILKEIGLSTTFSQSIIKNRLLELLCEISRSIGIYEYCPSSEIVAGDRRVKAAKMYIRDNINKFVTCNEVASQCGLSTKQMNRIFFTETGKKLHDYINIAKIKEAERLLTDTSLPIKVISESLGFSSVYYFNRFFSKNAGLTPAYFRKISAK